MRTSLVGAAVVVVGSGMLGSCVLPELTIDEQYGTAGSSGSNGQGGVSAGGSNTGKGGGGSGAGGSAGSAKGGNGGSNNPDGGRGGAAGSSGSNSGGTAGVGGVIGGNGGAMGGNGGAMGGNGGTAGAGGSPVTLSQLVGSLDGRLIQIPCNDNPNADDCSSFGAITNGQVTACSNGSLQMTLDHPIGGTPGATYQVTMHFYGIMEPKDYGDDGKRECERLNGGMMCAPQNINTGATNLFYIGDPNEAYTTTLYQSYEIHVIDQNDLVVGTYFVNSDYVEAHYTYVVNYARTIPVIGGGKVRLRIYDGNCRIIKNCGAMGGYPCAAKARTVDISAASPQPQMGAPPAGFTQPGLGETNDHAGQWWLIDVTGFTQGG